jgi:hypothetical protein
MQHFSGCTDIATYAGHRLETPARPSGWGIEIVVVIYRNTDGDGDGEVGDRHRDLRCHERIDEFCRCCSHILDWEEEEEPSVCRSCARQGPARMSPSSRLLMGSHPVGVVASESWGHLQSY